MLNKLTKKIKDDNVKKIVAGVGIATATAVAASGAAAATLEPVTADYKFTVENKYKGSATRSLTKAGSTWKYKVKARVAGVATGNQSSSFKLSGNKVVPIKAMTSYKMLGVGRTHRLSFTANGKKVTSTYKGKSKTFSAPNGAYDDLSLEAQIRQDLLSGTFNGNYYMAKKNKVEKTPFKKVGSYTIKVPAGSFKTVRVDRIHGDKSRSTSFWLAPSLDYLPVKVVQKNDGKLTKMELTKVRS